MFMKSHLKLRRPTRGWFLFDSSYKDWRKLSPADGTVNDWGNRWILQTGDLFIAKLFGRLPVICCRGWWDISGGRSKGRNLVVNLSIYITKIKDENDKIPLRFYYILKTYILHFTRIVKFWGLFYWILFSFFFLCGISRLWFLAALCKGRG